MDLPDDLVLLLGAIPGNFSGATSPLQGLRIGRAQSIRWSPDNLSEIVGSKAGRLGGKLEQAISSSVRMVPEDARFARLSTTVWSKKNAKLNKAVGFVDPETGNDLVLVYFDKACRLSGSLTQKSPSHEMLSVEFNVEVPSPGWMWIKIERSDPLHLAYSSAVALHPILVIAPPERFGHANRLRGELLRPNTGRVSAGWSSDRAASLMR